MGLDCRFNKNVTHNQSKDFAMWFAANFKFHDSTLKGEMYIAKSGKVISSIDDIFDKWLNELQ